MNPSESDGWQQWSKHVLIELKRLNHDLEKMNTTLGEVKLEIAMLKVKAGMWGAFAGMIPAIIAIGVQILTQK